MMRKGNTRFMEQVLALYQPAMRRKATCCKMRQVLREFAAICDLERVSPATIARWISMHPERRPATVDSLLRSLRAGCTCAAGVGLLTSNPFDFRKPAQWVDWDVEELDAPVHDGQEIARVLRLADDEASGGDWRAKRLRAVVYTAAYTGARKREILGLAVADVDLERRLVSMRTNAWRRFKTRASVAQIAVSKPLARVLAEWIPLAGPDYLFPGVERVGPWFDGVPGSKPLDQLKALGMRAGVHGLTFQSLRHTFASLAEGWNIGELALQRVLRHTRIRTQRAYRHPLDEVLRDVAAKVHFP